MSDQTYQTFEDLLHAIQAKVLRVGVGLCRVEVADDVMTRRVGYLVDGEFFQVPLTTLRSSPWAKTLAASREVLIPALERGELPSPG